MGRSARKSRPHSVCAGVDNGAGGGGGRSGRLGRSQVDEDIGGAQAKVDSLESGSCDITRPLCKSSPLKWRTAHNTVEMVSIQFSFFNSWVSRRQTEAVFCFCFFFFLFLVIFMRLLAFKNPLLL